jgi:hypothetical protein
MAYEGKITFLDIPTEKVSWNVDIRFPSKSSESLPPALSAEAHDVQLSDPPGNYSIYLDNVAAQEIDLKCLKCIIIGQDWSGWEENQVHYVLLISAKERDYFERIGIAKLKKRHLNLEKKPMKVQIT